MFYFSISASMTIEKRFTIANTVVDVYLTDEYHIFMFREDDRTQER